jgi:hypothetical protein
VCSMAVAVMVYMRVMSARRARLTSSQGKLVDLPVCTEVPVWADVVRVSGGVSGVSWPSGPPLSASLESGMCANLDQGEQLAT